MKHSDKTVASIVKIKSYLLYGALAWTVIIGLSLIWNLLYTNKQTMAKADVMARLAFEKDVSFRTWVTKHGGVYVPVTDETTPNPYLLVPDRDVTTRSGKNLTLMNPAYVMRQYYEDFQRKGGVRGHITSLKPLRPENRPGPWEKLDLLSFEAGKKEAEIVQTLDGDEYVRLMKPLILTKGCLKCHAFQGYKEGDIRGGISISVPMEPLRHLERYQMLMLSVVHTLLWLVGLSGIIIFGRIILKSELQQSKADEALHESEEKFRIIFESSRDALMTLEPPSWGFTSGNPATIAMFRAKDEKDFISHAPWQLSPEHQPDGSASDEKARDMIKTVIREGSHFFEWTHKRIDGEEFPATVLLTRMELAGRRFLQATIRDITVYKQAEESIKRLNQQNKLILDAAGEGIFGLDSHGNHTFMNPSAAQMLGYTVDELLDINSHRTCHYKKADGSPYPAEECPIYLAYKDGKVHHVTDEVFWRKDGTSYPVEYTSTPIIEDGKITGAVVTFMDITERRQAEKALFDSEAYLKTLMSAIQAGVIVIDVEKHTITDINMAAENLIGDKREAIIGKECHKYVCPAEKGKCPITDLNQIVDRSERVLINAKGEKIPILKTVVPLTIKGRKYLIESFIDISERKRMEEELQRLSVTDNLTQVYNRTKYEEVIKREIERTKRTSSPLSVAMLDIDHFKAVNDTYGHAVGDYVLKTLSQIARKNMRDIDYLIRWGGEEFLVIALDTDLRGAEVLAEKIRKAIENYNFEKVGRVTVSFGVTQFKQDDTEDPFMKRADDALYQAKEKGRNRVETV